METVNLADMTKNSANLYASVKKVKVTHFQRNIEEVVKSLWRRTDGIFTDNPRHTPES